MAQTSVEWLIEQLSSKHIGFEMYVNANKETIEQAKEIEKKQHSRTWDAALDAYEKRGHVYVRAWEDFDEYYNEKFDNK